MKRLSAKNLTGEFSKEVVEVGTAPFVSSRADSSTSPRKLGTSSTDTSASTTLQSEVDASELESETSGAAHSVDRLATSTPLRLQSVPEGTAAVAGGDEIENIANIPVMTFNEAELSMTRGSTLSLSETGKTQLSPEAQAILLSTPELQGSQLSIDSMRLSKLQDERHQSEGTAEETKSARERMNNLSLFAELSSQEPTSVGEIDTGSNLSSVGKELESLIKENDELHSTK